MNKITPSRTAIFSSEVMMKKASIAVVNFTSEAPVLVRLVESSMRRDELVPGLTGAEHRDVQPGLRSLVRLLLRRWDASAATLQFPACARRDRRFCLDSTRRIAGLFRSSAGKHLQSNEASRRRRLPEGGRVISPSHREHCPAREWHDLAVASGPCRLPLSRVFRQNRTRAGRRSPFLSLRFANYSSR